MSDHTNNNRRRLNLAGAIAYLMGVMLDRWPVILIAAYVLTGTGPHLRVSYEYRGTYSNPVYISCTYLGPRGFITPPYGVMYDCPVVAWLHSGAVWQ